MGKDNLGNRFVGSDIPQWQKRGYISRENTRRQRKEAYNKKVKKALRMGKRPPLSKAQKAAGARRLL